MGSVITRGTCQICHHALDQDKPICHRCTRLIVGIMKVPSLHVETASWRNITTYVPHPYVCRVCWRQGDFTEDEEYLRRKGKLTGICVKCAKKRAWSLVPIYSKGIAGILREELSSFPRELIGLIVGYLRVSELIRGRV